MGWVACDVRPKNSAAKADHQQLAYWYAHQKSCNDHKNMNPYYIALIGFAGVIFGGTIQVIIARFNHISTQKMAYRKLAIEAGLENWRINTAMKMDAIKSGAKGNIRMDSPDSYISHMLNLIDTAGDMSITPKQAASKINDNKA